MMLTGKITIVYGGGGVIGGAIARAFADEGAGVHLAGRTRSKLEAVADVVAKSGGPGGVGSVAEVDVLDEAAVTRHAAGVAAEAGGVDVVVDAVGFVHVQGTPLEELSGDDFQSPIRDHTQAWFHVAKAAAPHLVARGGGVLLALTTPGGQRAFPGVLGFGAACAAVESMTRHLAAELSPRGVRVLALMPDALPEAVAAGSHSREVFAPGAAAAGQTVDQMADAMLSGGNDDALLRRWPSVDQVARTAAFVASDGAGAMTGQVVNLTSGSLVG